MKKNRICVVTGSRSEYGLLKPLMKLFFDDESFDLQIIATGAHLSPEFGETYKQIIQDGFSITCKVESLLSTDSVVGVAKSTGLGIIGFADAFANLQPDFVIILGDRYEIFAAAFAAFISNIKVIHIHGGEKTIGANDDSMRHAITKMAHIHFVATDEYRNRVIQLGERPENVYCSGGLGVDIIDQIVLIPKHEIEKKLLINFCRKNLLITFHPASLNMQSSILQLENLLNVLMDLKDTALIFTFPNSDSESRKIIKTLEAFVRRKKNAYLFESLGQEMYFSVVNCVDAVIGNSSSGLLEVPSLRKGTINIGDRQHGRVCADSVINSDSDIASIKSALKKLYSKKFQDNLSNVKNPYGNGGSSKYIFNIIKNSICVDKFSLKKNFYDINFAKE